jgi:hypothetical protein
MELKRGILEWELRNSILHQHQIDKKSKKSIIVAEEFEEN